MPRITFIDQLGGENTLVVNGLNAGDNLGLAAGGGGDFNGDGVNDFVLTARGPGANDDSYAGEVYVIFGQSNGFAPTFDLSEIDGTNGLKITPTLREKAGISVDVAGDINGDGIDDLLIAAPYASSGDDGHGAVYIVFGSDQGFPAEIKLGDLNGTNGFAVFGDDPTSEFAYSAIGLGDINGDGFDDFIVGADDAEPQDVHEAGTAYVVFGSDAGFPANLNVSSLDGSNGFSIPGREAQDNIGLVLGAAGDVNGDGLNDIILGAPFREGDTGTAYVIFGSSNSFGAEYDLSTINGSNGFAISGETSGDYLGVGVSGIGDLNGDGIGDIALSAPRVDDNATDAGAVYVLFGRTDGFPSDISVAAVNGSTGFVVRGLDARDAINNVAAAGDVNGDGLDDLVIGARLAEPGEEDGAGQAYILFGSREGFPDAIELFNRSTDTVDVGAFINGQGAGDRFGSEVVGVGDVNGDGTDDLLVTSPGNGSFFAQETGTAYILYGQAAIGQPVETALQSSIRVDQLNGSNGFVVEGSFTNQRSGEEVANIGDINADGFDDFAIRAPGEVQGVGDESVHVVFGGDDLSREISLSGLDGSNGFSVLLSNFIGAGQFGQTVGAAGDVNNDGIDDFLITDEFVEFDGRSAAGVTYVIYGRSDGYTSELSLRNFDSSQGFVIGGAEAGDFSGFAASAAGDVNGDGIDDILIGAQSPTVNGIEDAGSAYVVFGSASETRSDFDLATIDGDNGFRLIHSNPGIRLGLFLTGGGDINGDGFDDVVVVGQTIGDLAQENGQTQYIAYAVFGSDQGLPQTIDVSQLDGTNGFAFEGGESAILIREDISFVGDINGDGLDDFAFSNFVAAPGGDTEAGETYIVFGRSRGFPANFSASDLNGSNGFIIAGADPGDVSGFSISGGGDINGDGFDDIIVGAPGGDPNGSENAGEAFVIFGRGSGFGSLLDLSVINNSNGFVLEGRRLVDRFGAAVATGGDINGDGFDDIIVGALHADPTARSAGTTYVIYGGPNVGETVSEDRYVVGTFLADSLEGTDQADTLIGGAGNDTLEGRGESDRLDGGEGLDSASYSSSQSAVVLNLGTGVAAQGDAAEDQLVSIENLIGSSFADRLIGNDAANRLVGNGGGDTLVGSDGEDTLEGGAGNDLLSGDRGDDSLSGGSSSDTLEGGRGADLLDGGSGADVAVYSNSSSAVTINLGAGVFARGDADGDTIINVENIVGSIFADRLVGDGNANHLVGNAGGDTLIGGAGADTLEGGSGDDTFFAGSGDASDDFVVGGAGNDLAAGGAGHDLIVGDAVSVDGLAGASGSDGSDTIYGGSGNDVLLSGGWNDANNNSQFDTGEEDLTDSNGNTAYAGTGNDLVFGAAGDDILGGGAGGDTLNGGAGDDVFYGGKGATDNDDVFDAGAGDDTVFGGSGSDVLNGFAGADQLFGGSGNDTIDGGDGADSLFGASGNDVLTGGSGADAFFFGGDHGDDVVTDFDAATDTLFLGNAVTDFTDLASAQAAATATTQNGQSGLLIDTVGGNSVFPCWGGLK